MKAKKFNTFSGVFTPSILTIIGVIMYLRLPAIVGQAGLMYTLGIILVAHIISVTTSLSIASLATDKPVQTGGPYFIISRSMGLPIGGTLGLALFTGYAFSISLYLIGFAESFLQYWNIEAGINAIRITGGIALLAITAITFISTSLALKSQFVIMTAIVLSLLSIFLGNHNFTPETVNLKPIADAAPFMVLFGIFFPAVTGFGAGISMSGDLKDPKRSLPLGTLMAVGVGLLIYVGFTLFLSYTVDPQELVNNPQILFQISWIPALVIAGIWGATLSSALGSILGAPRILQAIAIDKIIPGIFAKGTKKNNEPRNALWIAFGIAGAGIMIGELDVIARIVSMFFITTYAFLNLAFTIESWSSPDFRPAFKIPGFVSILGALSAFLVMILLDFIALAGATIVLTGLYIYLQRKEMLLESGDAWSSFYTSLAKKALLKLSVRKDNERNWRPNIVVFRGGGKARPHLVELGLSLTGKLGALTDFELIETNENIGNSGIATESVKSKQRKTGYFIRQLKCNTIAEGIKTVTSIYGFSGFEPNTVMLGWSKSSESSEFLSDMIKDFKIKNLNAIFLDYDKVNGFGNKESIDIWWNGKGRHLTFSINILRILLSDPLWRDARVRIMIVNSNTSTTDSLYRNTNAYLIDKRIKAEVKIISDDFGSRTLEEIINSNSTDTDLIMLGLTQKNIAQTQVYIEKVNKICALPGSVLLLRPSFEFEEINFVDSIALKTGLADNTDLSPIGQLPDMSIPIVMNKVTKLDGDLMKLGKDFCENSLMSATSLLQTLCTNLFDVSSRVFNNLENQSGKTEVHLFQQSFNRNIRAYQRNVLGIIKKEYPKIIKETAAIWQNGISDLILMSKSYINKSTETISVPFLLSYKKREKIVSFPLRKALYFYLETKFKSALFEELTIFEDNSKKIFTELQNLFFEISDILEKLYIDSAGYSEEKKDRLSALLKRIKALHDELGKAGAVSENSLMMALREISIEIAENLSAIESIKVARKSVKAKTINYDDRLAGYAENWESGMYLLNNAFCLDLMVLSSKTLFKKIVITANYEVSRLITDALLARQDILIQHLHSATENDRHGIYSVSFPDNVFIMSVLKESYENASALIINLPEDIKIPESIYKENEFKPFSEYNGVSVNVQKTAFQYLGALFYEPMYRDYETLETAVKTAIAESKEANNLLMFQLHNLQDVEDHEHSDELNVEIFNKLIKNVRDQRKKIEIALMGIQHDAITYINESFSRLFYQSLKETGRYIHVDAHRKKSGRIFLSLARIYKMLKHHSNSLFIQLLNISSSSVIASKTLLDERRLEGLQSKEILDLVEEISPDPATYNSIPVFYRNLMSSESKIPNEFWVERTAEIQAIKTAHNRHRSGYGGALMITGVHGSGKTTLVRYAASQLFDPQKTIWVNAPGRGSTDPEILLAEFKKNSGNYNDFQEIFDSLTHESVVVFDDLELWWERRSGGGEAIQLIIQLIKLYSNKVLFILNCNTHAFSVIEQIYPIGEHILANITCSRFKTKDIQQMVLKRHRSSGISISYKGKEENNISQLSYSLLFHKCFIVSDGIPGVALNNWVRNIKRADSDTIEIQKPVMNHPDVLFNLKNEWLIILTLFIQHKNIDAEKLSVITGTSIEKSEDVLQNIMNTGLVIKNTKGFFTLNRNVEHLIVKVCEKKGLI